MLAYVFWHHPRVESDVAAYESSMASLHDSLHRAGIAGFVTSTTYRIGNVPWMAGADPLYEDWYLIDDWTALGVLNEAAVTGTRKSPHDGVAAAYAAGAGAIYHLRTGNHDLSRSRVDHWLAKPKGMAYAAFDALVEPVLARGCTVWRRQMVLAPSPEFCLTSAEAVNLPAPLDVRTLRGQTL